jgi:hypothetical protein
MAENYLDPRLYMPPARNALNSGADPWAWRSDMDVPQNALAQATLKPGPAPTGRDKIFDAIYGAFGGKPDKRRLADTLTSLFDVGTLGMATGAYDGAKDLAQTGRPSALAMALMPGARITGAPLKAGAKALSDLVRLYHGTSEEGFGEINRLGSIWGPAFFSPRREVAESYAEANGGDVLSALVPKEHLLIDADLPGARLMTVDEANVHLDNPGWSIDDYLRNGQSVGVKHDVPIER